MKKVILFICLFLFSVSIINAEELKGKVTSSTGIIVRSKPTTNSDSISDGLKNGREVTIVETITSTDKNDNCGSKKWYKIVYEDSSTGYGYACSNFVLVINDNVEVDTNFEDTLKLFPESYHEYLTRLHNIYPNALFTPLNATWQDGSLMTFEEVVDGEITEGKNLIWDSNNSRDGWKLLSSYIYETNKFRNNYSGGGKNWYAVNKDILSYYLDPRNFLNETDIFMFESVLFYPNYHTKDGVESMLEGSFMHDTFVDDSKTIKFSDAIMDAARSTNASPYFIASRILQEVGATRSDLVLGTYPPSDKPEDIERYSKYAEFTGYYNFYNIGAGGTDVVYNGLTKAKNSGWDSEYKAIVKGAESISSSYISLGQDTLYLQKWDINCEGWRNCLSNQYMQNIEAPTSEARNTYDAYLEDLGSLMYTKEFVFLIPVYKDMPELTVKPSKKSPINYLNTLVVDGKSLANFTGLKTTYNLTVPAGTTNIHIEATPKNSKAKISGIGNIKITSDSQVVKVVVTAENGTKKTYKINVTRLVEEKVITLEDILKELTKNFKDKYMIGITSYDDLIHIIDKVDNGTTVSVKNLDGKIIKDGSIATGYKITIGVNEETKIFDAIIYGDNNGDSEISVLDLLRVQKHLLNSINLAESQLKASDVNKDDKVDILDLLLVQKHLLGSSNIIQGG